ncbi:GCN5-related N-acetyltransferase [Magnetococcus marinus MC-1]|uniref:GCN5-related N-acetyltransferase n=1 Tax=Magnetococcus marinus (strain ATCC BAA-1437 / JCM 17883 / MC-1) TaxID=156889 RepID=A0L451_MAGMM|nr:N-acetylglutaminylglutamine synthetase [Magnetococcus marinus]ABK42744.1 GCN5-related N-acetyltransferase [Magnetococcus marinus MC-1]
MAADQSDTRLFVQATLASLKNWGEPHDSTAAMLDEAVIDCGWGKLVFGQTFSDNQALCQAMRAEQPGQRNVALYLRDPHVVLSLYPQELFLDPSHTYRLALTQDPWQDFTPPAALSILPIRGEQDMAVVRQLYETRRMVPPRAGFRLDGQEGCAPLFLIAIDEQSEQIVGVVNGVDHRCAFNDPENGSSLWALAVDRKTAIGGVGEALVRALAHHFWQQGRGYMDLSVMHDNEQAIALYNKLGFKQIPVYCLKNKNPINERLFSGPAPEANLSIYSRIIVDEARRRGISVEVLDQSLELFRLKLGGRTVLCRESLSSLTSATAMTVCDNKRLTSRLLKSAGLQVPEQMVVGKGERVENFLARHGAVVVKPVRGEQGRGISVDVRDLTSLEQAIAKAQQEGDGEQVLLERLVVGDDLRIIVIGHEVVAAAVRKPPMIRGDGHSNIAALIQRQSRRRAAATEGESRIPLDGETQRCVQEAGLEMHSILDKGQQLLVRRAANLHTGGTIHDVTEQLHPALREAAEQASMVLDMPLVGLDFLVPDVQGPDYVIIEANERPGLANHEPQPTAKRFIDMLFPQTTLPRCVSTEA